MSTWKKITAAEVRKLPVGTWVRVYSFDRHGYPQYMDCMLVPWGQTKKLRCSTHSGPLLYNITKETERRWYSVKEEQA